MSKVVAESRNRIGRRIGGLRLLLAVDKLGTGPSAETTGTDRRPNLPDLQCPGCWGAALRGGGVGGRVQGVQWQSVGRVSRPGPRQQQQCSNSAAAEQRH